jgi:hypothetical protein
MVTSSVSGLTARALQPVIAGLEALGHPAGGLLAEAGMSPQLLANPDERVPRGAMGRFWDRAVALTSCRDLLTLAQPGRSIPHAHQH